MPGVTFPAPPPPPSGYSGPRAPVIDVPQERIVSIEHPCLVKNFDNGFKSLGGEPQLLQILQHEAKGQYEDGRVKPVAGVSLRPHDPYAHKIASVAVETQNVLVKVTVPKRTGRKRKRGSDHPFQDADEPATSTGGITAPELLQRLQDSGGHYGMEAIGMVRDTHRFRNLPDFQMRAKDVDIMREVKEHAATSNYDTLKNLHIDLTPGDKGVTAFPGPPSFATSGLPVQYNYRQAATIQAKSDEKGEVKWATRHVRRSAPASYKMIRRVGVDLEFDEPLLEAPSTIGDPRRGPSSTKAHTAFVKLLQERPITTRRAMDSLIPDHTQAKLSEAIPHLGYFIKFGPWRETVAKYGVDPRKDSKYRLLQTVLFQEKDLAAFLGTADETHVFDGKTIVDVGKIWQLCDITDPVIRRLIDTDNLREECDVGSWGWYYNGTLAKIRTLMRDKMLRLLDKRPLLSDEQYEVIAALPDKVSSTRQCALDPDIHHRDVVILAETVGDQAMKQSLQGKRSKKVAREKPGPPLKQRHKPAKPLRTRPPDQVADEKEEEEEGQEEEDEDEGDGDEDEDAKVMDVNEHDGEEEEDE